MLDKMLGVSPPQKGLAQDSKDVDRKLLQQSDLKKEFDQKLKAQLKEKPSTGKDAKPEQKLATQDQKPKLGQNDKDELRADKNQKKPSGGPKKKMVEAEEQDETTISKVMASIESEVEIPDQRKDQAPVETESSQQNSKSQIAVGIPSAKGVDQGQDGLAKAIRAAMAKPEQSTEAATPEVAAPKKGVATAVELTPQMIAAFQAAAKASGDEQQQAPKVTEKESAQIALQMQQLAGASAPPTAEIAPQVAPVVDSSSLMAKSLQNLMAVTSAAKEASVSSVGIPTLGLDDQAATDSADDLKGLSISENKSAIPTDQSLQNLMAQQPVQQTQQQPAELSFEQQLQAEVEYEAEPQEEGKPTTAAALLQKMKSFEAEKGLSPKEANAFELKVLGMLQQERTQMLQAKSGEDSAEFSQHEKSDTPDSMKDMKGMGAPDAAMHAGQTQTDFRTHLGSPLERAGSPEARAQILNEHREENVQQVMKQAHFLASKGGGEMVVKMSPDGMGPIALKVMMQDGKVNIQMQTQDKEVKKLIEDSLTELKSGLAAQRIHVEHVKIDTVNATNTENQASFTPQQNSSDAQGRQQEFWKSFRDNFGNQSRKNSYGEVAAVPGRKQEQPDPLKPIATKARNGSRTGSTINRVA